MATLTELMSKNEKIEKAVKLLVKVNKAKAKVKKEKAEAQAIVIPVMKSEGIGSEKIEGLNFTYVEATERDKFNQKLAKQLLLDWGFDPEVIDLIWSETLKKSDVAESLRIS
jgi:ABC-type nitrate/sulfonate/bicarbonate transport system substrate-binding protein